MAATMRVRIAVCVTTDGTYSAAGYSGARDDDLFDMADPGGDTARQHYVWVEADVPLPIQPVVEGAVVGEPRTPVGEE